MTRLIELSHDIYDGMPGFSMTSPSGERIDCTARIREVLSHADTAPFYDGLCGFAYTEVQFYTSIGTRLDAPYVRYPEGRDVAALTLDELVLPGCVVDARGHAAGAAVGPEDLVLPDDLSGHAVLFNFGWDVHWGGDSYGRHPYLGIGMIDLLIERGAKLVGVDTVSVDGKVDPACPAHSRFLENDILIVEDLCHLDRLHGRAFRFFALPAKVRGAASMPVRAFAELLDGDGL
jgi:kynurenine formamidase